MSKFLTAFFFAVAASVALAAPPYDITVSFDPPVTGDAPDGYNLYIDDCAATGPTGGAIAEVANGETFSGILTADGVFEVCVRPYNAAGVLADPGIVATVDVTGIALPGPVENLTITVQCPNGGCSVNIGYL